MGKAVVLLGMMLVSVMAQASDVNQEWKDIVAALYDKGEVVQSREPNYVSFKFKRATSHSTDEERTIEYLTLAGKDVGENEFRPTYVSTVKEKWTREGDLWVVAQTILVSDLSGEVTRAEKYLMAFDDGRVMKKDVQIQFTEDEKAKIDETWVKEWRSWKELAEALPARVGEWYAKEREA